MENKINFIRNTKLITDKLTIFGNLENFEAFRSGRLSYGVLCFKVHSLAVKFGFLCFEFFYENGLTVILNYLMEWRGFRL